MNMYSSIDFNPFDGQEIQKICLTNESQREIWLSCVFGGQAASLAYNQSISIRFGGNLNVLALEKSCSELILRHEALRSSFSANGEQLMIYENYQVEIAFTDCSFMAENEKNDCMQEFVRKEMSTPFDLENGPLLRLNLHQFSPELAIFTLTTHHIIADGWSLNTLIKDLSDSYSLHVGKQVNAPLPVPFQISDFSLESILFKETDDYLTNENYWLNLYKDGIPGNYMPLDFPRPPNRTYLGQRIELALAPECPAALKSISVHSGCSLVTVMLCAFEVFIAKLTKQNEFVIGLFSAGRPESHHENLFSHCVNLLPLKASIDPSLTFNEYLQKRKGELFDALDHQQFTFSELIKKLYIPRDPSQVPLVPLVFNFDHGLGNEAHFEGLSMECTTNPREYENFELNVSVLWKSNEVKIQCTYTKDLFKASTITHWLNEFSFLISELIGKPSLSMHELLLEDPKKTFEQVYARNNTYVSFSKEETLLSYFHKTVETYAEKTAISYYEQEISFETLDQQSNQLAHILLEKGVKKGDNVGIALDRSPKVILSMLAVLKCGAVYIPLDPEFPHERIVYMLENSSAKVLITSKKYTGHFDSSATEVLMEECMDQLASYSIALPKVSIHGEDLAYILYTSGSTGKPKGVQVRHYNLLNFLLSMQKEPGIKPSDTWLAITTVSFDIAALEIFLPLISGAKIYLADEGMSRNGAALLSIIKNEGITIMQATPATWTMMLYEDWNDPLPIKILCGGEAFPKALAEKLLQRSLEVWNMYGPTETTVWSTVKQLSTHDQLITVGHPINNTMIYILDENQGMVPEGSEGEIYIAGDGLALGYMNRPDLSGEKFINNPFEPHRSEKMYGTGDLGIALENGEIQCLGRLDHQVKIRGFRIELGEIEHALSKIESVKEAVVIAREDHADDKRICAYIIPAFAVDQADMEEVLKTTWRRKIKESLPSYMIPNDFVLMDQFPLTPNGKIDRKQLLPPRSQMRQEAKEITPKEPTSPLAKKIAKIWAESLSIPVVAMEDDFFQLGGHSLLAVQLMVRIEKEIGKKLPLTSLFKYSTFESFLNLFEQEVHEETSIPSNSTNEDQLKGEEIIVPTTDSQKEMWLSCIIGGDQANLAFNLPTVLKLVGTLNEQALTNAVQDLIQRHEALRTNISESGESLIIHPVLRIPLAFNDFSNKHNDAPEKTIQDYMHREMNVPFHLSSGPLLRVSLHKFADDIHYFTLIIHHIICDGGSIDIFLEELSHYYNAYSSGEKLDLPAAPQISNFALDQLTFNNSNNYHLTQNYWLDQYKDSVPVMDLPVDFPRTAKRSYQGNQQDFIIGNSLFLNFKKITQESKCSMVTSLLSAFELFLHKQSKQHELVVGMPISGQTGSFYGLIGHCVNLLPLKNTVDEDETFDHYLKRRTNQLYKDYDHQRLTYGELLKQLTIKRDPTRIPLIPVMFSMRLGEDIALKGLSHSFEQYPLVAQTFELSLYVLQNEDDFELTWAYNPDLFKKETIERFHLDFTEIVKQIGLNPTLKIKDLRLKQIQAVTGSINHRAASTANHSDQGLTCTGPKTDMESIVAEIWSEHLNMPIINVKSDFFELGGHSMIAVKIMMQIEKRIGKRLPLATLFENSTIETLAKKIESDKKERWKSLVPIKTSGNKPPLYIVHGKGMNVIAFKALESSIDEDQPLYALQPKGLDPNDDPHTSIEEIAKGYVQELVSHNPKGPYAIAGYSSGGTIALEIADQLLKMNKKVLFVGLIDTFYGGDSYASLLKKNKFKEIFNHAFNFIGYGFVYLVRYPKPFLQHKINFILGTLYNQYKKLNPIKKDLSNPLYILDRVQKTHDKAFEKYAIKHYNTNVTLFKGNQNTLVYIPDLATNGFGPYIQGDLTVIDLPIDHLNFFDTNYANIFAKTIQEELNRCNQLYH